MIPSCFEIMGHTISVEITKEVPDGSEGTWIPDRQLIKLLPIGKKMSEQGQAQAFWHEVMHCILDTLSYDKLSADEAFVDRMGHCLYQLEKTRK